MLVKIYIRVVVDRSRSLKKVNVFLCVGISYCFFFIAAVPESTTAIEKLDHITLPRRTRQEVTEEVGESCCSSSHMCCYGQV